MRTICLLLAVIQGDAEGHIAGIIDRREAWDLVWSRVP
jgi:hypothetical protein